MGVLEYVLIDRMRHRATVYTAGPRGYRKRILRPGEVYASPLLPGLALSVVLRLIDGAMRNSIYRTSTELLYLPLPLRVRGRVKASARKIASG